MGAASRLPAVGRLHAPRKAAVRLPPRPPPFPHLLLAIARSLRTAFPGPAHSWAAVACRLVEMQAGICQQMPHPPVQFPPSLVLDTHRSAGAMRELAASLRHAEEADAAPWRQDPIPLHEAPPPSSLCILAAADADAAVVASRRFAVARVLTAARFDAGRRLAQFFQLPAQELHVACIVDVARSAEEDGGTKLRQLLAAVRRVVSDRKWGKVSEEATERQCIGGSHAPRRRSCSRSSTTWARTWRPSRCAWLSSTPSRT